MNRILCHRREIESKNIHRKTRNVFQNNSKVICRDWHEHICAPLPRSLSQANSSQDKSSDGNASWAEPTEPKPRRDTPRQDKTSVAKKSATATSDKALLEITWNTRVCPTNECLITTGTANHQEMTFDASVRRETVPSRITPNLEQKVKINPLKSRNYDKKSLSFDFFETGYDFVETGLDFVEIDVEMTWISTPTRVEIQVKSESISHVMWKSRSFPHWFPQSPSHVAHAELNPNSAVWKSRSFPHRFPQSPSQVRASKLNPKSLWKSEKLRMATGISKATFNTTNQAYATMRKRRRRKRRRRRRRRNKRRRKGGGGGAGGGGGGRGGRGGGWFWATNPFFWKTSQKCTK